MKKISEFLSENFQFLVVKFSINLNRHVFVTIKRIRCRLLKVLHRMLSVNMNIAPY